MSYGDPSGVASWGVQCVRSWSRFSQQLWRGRSQACSRVARWPPRAFPSRRELWRRESRRRRSSRAPAGRSGDADPWGDVLGAAFARVNAPMAGRAIRYMGPMVRTVAVAIGPAIRRAAGGRPEVIRPDSACLVISAAQGSGAARRRITRPGSLSGSQARSVASAACDEN